jgi:5-hydroxyisourate hydrolase
MSSASVTRRLHLVSAHLSPLDAMSSVVANPTAGSSGGLDIAVSTHVLNTATGQPAADVRVTFESLIGADSWTVLGESRTNSDGRVGSFPHIQTTAPTADYRLRFASGEYFIAQGHAAPFFPQVTIQWQVSQAADKDRAKLHIPLLISPFGYSSYRGS